MSRSIREYLVGGVAGAVFVAAGAYLAGIIGITKGNHDEPIIIEEGSIKVDFDRNNNTPDDPGEPIDDSIFRWEADPPVRLRLWLNKDEVMCPGGQKCMLGGDSLSVNSTGRPLAFIWHERKPGKPDIHGLRMKKDGQQFLNPDPSFPSRFESEDKKLKIESVSFRDLSGKPQRVDFKKVGSSDKVSIQICFVDDEKHCPAYTQ